MQIIFGIFLGVFVLSIIVLAAKGLLVGTKTATDYTILFMIAAIFIGIIAHYKR